MKKLLFGIFAVLCITLGIAATTNKNPAGSQATRKTTLDGIDSAAAVKMFKDFLRNPGVYNSPTSVWYNRRFIDRLYKMLHKEKADGFRVYFTRTADGKNSLALVSTRKKLDKRVSPNPYHQDYFTHAVGLLQPTGTAGKPDYGTAGGGALLYVKGHKCPSNAGCDTTRSHYVSCGVSQIMVNTFGGQLSQSPEWFDIGFLDTLRKEIHNGNGDGLRVYYAKRLNSAYAQFHGFVFITTSLKNGVSTDYFQCHPKALGRGVEPRARMVPVAPTIQDDNGEQCCPSCPGATVYICPDGVRGHGHGTHHP